MGKTIYPIQKYKDEKEIKMPKRYFTKKDLSKIKKNTNNNNHGENYEFIAKKIHSKTEKQFKTINKECERLGYLPHNLSQKRYNLYERLIIELRRKSPMDYQEVYGRL